MRSLARTRVTPNQLTTAGVSLCLGSSVLVYFEYRDEKLFFWLGALVFVIGSLLDILDGALARAGGKATPLGAFVDSTTDRMGEAAMLGAIGLVFMRHGHEFALGATFAAVAGSFLVSYTRARAEALGLRGDVGLVLARRACRDRDRRSRARSVGRPSLGDLRAHRQRVGDRAATDPLRPQAAREASARSDVRPRRPWPDGARRSATMRTL